MQERLRASLAMAWQRILGHATGRWLVLLHERHHRHLTGAPQCRASSGVDTTNEILPRCDQDTTGLIDPSRQYAKQRQVVQVGAEELADELWSPTAASLAAASRLNRAANYRQKTWPRLAVCCCVNNQFLGCFFFLCCRVSGEWPKLCWWRSGV